MVLCRRSQTLLLAVEIHGGFSLTQPSDSRTQNAFARALCRAIRDSRRRQHLTQADLAQRTNGLLSKAALANYETGHRSLRVDVLWVIAQALGEDIKTLVDSADLQVRRAPSANAGNPITIRVDEVLASTDPRLAAVKRWVELRATGPQTMMILDDGVITALATLMGMSVPECRRVLMSATDEARPAPE
jgi:transcriptional regulator with XRE-family HTH domain